MRKDDTPYTNEQMAALMQELEDYRHSHLTPEGKPIPRTRLSLQIGLGATTLSDLRSTRGYKGDVQKCFRFIDDFLADERLREGRFNERSFCEISITARIFGVFKTAVKHRSIGLIVADPGGCKTAHAHAFARMREGVVIIRIDDANGDGRGITALLYQALRLVGCKSHRQRLSTIISHVRKNKNLVIIIDEAQNLGSRGLETIRDIYDASDPEGRYNVPIILLGDRQFYRLIERSREGEPSPIKPQFTSRLSPILNVADDLRGHGGDDRVFSVDDIVRIVKNHRIRVVTEEGLKMLAALANLWHRGAMRLAVKVFSVAVDLASHDGVSLVDVKHLEQAIYVKEGTRVGSAVIAEVEAALGGAGRRAALAGG